MANVPSMFEFAVPVAAGLLYALIWYSTRTLPRAGQDPGARGVAPHPRAGGALSVVRHDDATRSASVRPRPWSPEMRPCARARDEADGARAADLRAACARTSGRRHGGSAASSATGGGCAHAAITGASTFGAAQRIGESRRSSGRRRSASRCPRCREDRLGRRAGVLRHRPRAQGRAPSASSTPPTGRGAWNSAARW